MSTLQVIGSNEFQAAIAQGAVLVEFGAPWCGPCKALEPLVARLGEESDGKLLVVKVDIDVAQELAADFGIMSVPTLMLFKDGKKLGARSGSQSMSQLQAFVKDAL